MKVIPVYYSLTDAGRKSVWVVRLPIGIAKYFSMHKENTNKKKDSVILLQVMGPEPRVNHFA